MDSERIAMIIDEKEYWHPSDDEVINHLEDDIPFVTIIDTKEVQDGKVKGVYERDDDGRITCVRLFEVPKGFTNTELCTLLLWLNEHHVP
jgi:hypothetical protein